jgi:hypothetical protein
MDKCPEDADGIAAVHEGGTEGCCVSAWDWGVQIRRQGCKGLRIREEAGDGCVGV